MSDKTGIQWTDATWNPVTGCSKLSPGCANCYAAALAPRLARMGQAGYTELPWTPENAAQNVVLRPERLHQPFRWKTPRRIFVNSMSDLFHELVPSYFIDEVLGVTQAVGWHTYQVLTKRPERMRVEMERIYWGREPFPNLWLGTSIENDRHVFRADHLRATPAAVRFISAEPLLGPLPSLDLTGIDWLIVGGESGPKHRPVDPGWVSDLRDRATAQRVAFFFKQWGGRTPNARGRLLDGRTWDEYPR